MKLIPYLVILIICIPIYLNETTGKKMKLNTFKAFKSFKPLKKMMKAVSATQTAAAVIDKVAAKDRYDTWDFSYYDRKFHLIGGQLNLINNSLEALSNDIDQID